MFANSNHSNNSFMFPQCWLAGSQCLLSHPQSNPDHPPFPFERDKHVSLVPATKKVSDWKPYPRSLASQMELTFNFSMLSHLKEDCKTTVSQVILRQLKFPVSCPQKLTYLSLSYLHFLLMSPNSICQACLLTSNPVHLKLPSIIQLNIHS